MPPSARSPARWSVVPGGTCDGDRNGGAHARFNSTWGAMGAQMGTLKSQARAFQGTARGFLSQFKSLITAQPGEHGATEGDAAAPAANAPKAIGDLMTPNEP